MRPTITTIISLSVVLTGVTLAAQEPPRPAAGGGLAERFNRNGDGKLSRDELPRPEMFERLDANRDGFVTSDEARSGCGRR